MWFVNFLKWCGSLIEDQSGSISSKRVGFFWCLWMLSRAVQMPNVNEIVIYAIVGLAFGLAGLTIPEWFANKDFKSATTTETTTKTLDKKTEVTDVVKNP